MHNFKQLKIWQKGVDLAVDIYKEMQTLPKHEQYGIAGQMNRAAVSIPSQIAEGAGRNSEKVMSRYLNISLGSSYELETQLIIANKTNYLDNETFLRLQSDCIELQKMIYNFQKKISSTQG